MGGFSAGPVGWGWSDAEGGERLGVPRPATLLTDHRGRAIQGLDVPGTPFAIEVGADGRVIS